MSKLFSVLYLKNKLTIYSIIVVSIFLFGSYSGYKLTLLLTKEDTKQAFKAEEGLIKDDKKTEIIYKDRIKVVTEYVETSNNTECFTNDDIRMFNNQ